MYFCNTDKINQLKNKKINKINHYFVKKPMFIINYITIGVLNMNKWKKVGLTALAGSLVATSAFAGELSVSGGASLDYSSSTEAVGNPYSMGDSVSFSGSGDVDNGLTVTVSIELDGGTYDDYSLKMDAGDAGAITFSGASVGAGGLNAYGDKVPNAYEEVYDATDGDDNGVVGNMSSTNAFFYNGTFGDIGISAGWSPNAGASDTSYVVTYSGLMDGLVIGAGLGEVGTTQDEETMYVTYTVGALSLGMQRSEIDFAASGTNDEQSTHIGASFAVNDNLTISTGRHEVDMGASKEDEVSTGFSASYTMGSITIAGHANQTDSQQGTVNQDETSKSVNIGFAF